MTVPSASAPSRSCESTEVLPVNLGSLRCLKGSADRLDEVLDRAAGAIAADAHHTDWHGAYLDLRVAAEIVATWVSVVVSPHRSALGGAEVASRYEPVTGCGVCGRPLAAGQRLWCSNAHRQLAYRRRHQTGRAAAALPPVRSRREATVYECPSCEGRFAGNQYCLDCHTFARRVGPGGSCPHCGEAVAVSDLEDEEVMPRV